MKWALLRRNIFNRKECFQEECAKIVAFNSYTNVYEPRIKYPIQSYLQTRISLGIPEISYFKCVQKNQGISYNNETNSWKDLVSN